MFSAIQSLLTRWKDYFFYFNGKLTIPWQSSLSATVKIAARKKPSSTSKYVLLDRRNELKLVRKTPGTFYKLHGYLTDSSDRAVLVIYCIYVWFSKGQVLSRGCGLVVFFIFGLLVCLPRSHVSFSGCPTLQITVKASASQKFWPLCVRWLQVTGTWWPSRNVAVMEAEAGAPTVSSAPCLGPLSIRRCVLLDLGTPLTEEVSYCWKQFTLNITV